MEQLQILTLTFVCVLASAGIMVWVIDKLLYRKRPRP